MEEFDNGEAPRRVRAARSAADFQSAALLLDRFNREFECPTPGAEFLAGRLPELVAQGSLVVLAAGGDSEGDDGVAVVRFRPAIWTAGPEAYLAELYVVPGARRRGLGAELLAAVLEAARERGCATIELGTDEGDADAHRLYERFGFSNLTDPDAPEERRERMFVYERAL